MKDSSQSEEQSESVNSENEEELYAEDVNVQQDSKQLNEPNHDEIQANSFGQEQEQGQCQRLTTAPQPMQTKGREEIKKEAVVEETSVQLIPAPQEKHEVPAIKLPSAFCSFSDLPKVSKTELAENRKPVYDNI